MELKYPLKRQKRKKIKNAVDFLINFQINILFLYSIIIIKTTSCLFIKGINIYIKINNYFSSILYLSSNHSLMINLLMLELLYMCLIKIFNKLIL